MPRMTTWDRKIRLCEIETRPKKLGPHIVRNRPRLGADESRDASGSGKATVRIEASRDPLPFLKVPKESAQGAEVMGLAPCGNGLRFWYFLSTCVQSPTVNRQTTATH